MITRRGLVKLFGAGFLSLVATAAYPFTEVFRRPEIRRYKLAPNNWPHGLNLRVVILSDFHASEPWMSRDRIADICATANELQPDICLLLGDYAAGTNIVSDYVDAVDWAEALATLSAPLVYINSSRRLEKDGHAFWLAGLGDQMALRAGKRFNRAGLVGIDDLAATLSSITDDAPVILMAHEPDIFPRIPSRVGLTLCGHTHGGQIDLFGWRPAAASRGSRSYPGGLYREGERDLLVSRGLGCSFIPVRVGVRPEILLLQLGTA